VEGTDVEGVIGVPPVCDGPPSAEKCSGNSEVVVITEPASDVAEPRRAILGLTEDGTEGVRDWRSSIRLARETGCTSGVPFLKRKVLTWTDLGASAWNRSNLR
jgi:hypothetical protein